MSSSTISISAAPFIPLSASYQYDAKLDMNATLFQYGDGYSFFQQPLFEGTKDTRFANESFFSITSAALLNSLVTDVKLVDPTSLVIFTGLLAANGKYITNVNNSLYATATSVGTNEFFQVIRNSDNTWSISQNDLYATVVTNNNDFSIVMSAKLIPDTNSVQKFVIYSAGDSDAFTIQTQFTIPAWTPYLSNPIERFLSYYDSDGSNKVKAIGLARDGNYPFENNYRFTASTALNMLALGFDGKVMWVRYYNELLNKFFNKNVDIKDIISDLKQNYLVEYPYKTQVTLDSYQTLLKTGTIKLNLKNLKNIMTPEYNYGVKKA